MKLLPASLRAFTLAVPLVSALLAGCASGGAFNPRPIASSANPSGTTDLHVAEGALRAGDIELATTLFEKSLTANPNSAQALLGLGDSMYLSGDLARARSLYERAAQQLPDKAAAQLGLARVALKQRRLDDAAALYRALMAAQPDNPVVSEGLGAVLDLEGRHADAQAVYRRSLAAHPEEQGLRVDLGMSLILENRPREAANTLLDIAGLPNAPLQARQNLALAYGLLGNTEAAKQILLVDLPPSSADDNLRFYQSLRDRLADNTARGAGANAAAVTAGGAPLPGDNSR
ncbi:tetratricopeptide repeat protein [Paraburkholderia sp. MPAMCS5]|uniref:tetratricopeptide repeat protein n=1 Tax=Paraburkholderia sp. MPAMCS5 TaxID=3112563 RepID=UPI002E18B856|nr:tetratricopeptide repeat protein [Paraburkholderia sp. MPAMCS5]